MTRKTEPEVVEAEIVEEVIASTPKRRSRSKASEPEKIVKYLIHQSGGRGSSEEIMIEVPDTVQAHILIGQPCEYGRPHGRLLYSRL